MRRRPIGDPVTVEIESLSHDGRGVARVDGKALFVWGALAGEQVLAQKMREGKDFDEADVVEVLRASPDRVEPKCPVFGSCGGCSMQHLQATKQIEAKQQVLMDNLSRIGKVEPEQWLAPLTAAHWGYRRRARVSVKDVPKKGRVLVGFREREAPAITVMDSCDVLHPAVSALLTPLSEVIGTLTIKARLPQVEISVGEPDSKAADNGGEVIAMVFRVLDPPTTEDKDALKAFAAEYNVDVYLQPKGPDTVNPLTKPRRLFFSIPKFGVEINFGPLDFIQINGPLNDVMIDHALGLLNVQPTERVLDLFCGLGNFTLPLAKQAAEVVGIEGEASLVRHAQANVAWNSLSNVSYEVANLFEEQRHSNWMQKQYDAVLLDPPRAGAKEILPSLPATGAKRIVYVSCHPGTLARDANILANELGYKLVSAGVMDMFPHTAHVESIALFEIGD